MDPRAGGDAAAVGGRGAGTGQPRVFASRLPHHARGRVHRRRGARRLGDAAGDAGGGAAAALLPASVPAHRAHAGGPAALRELPGGAWLPRGARDHRQLRLPVRRRVRPGAGRGDPRPRGGRVHPLHGGGDGVLRAAVGGDRWAARSRTCCCCTPTTSTPSTLAGWRGCTVRRGYTFVPLEQALADSAYASADTYTGPAGITWLHRWALTRASAAPSSPASRGARVGAGADAAATGWRDDRVRRRSIPIPDRA